MLPAQRAADNDPVLRDLFRRKVVDVLEKKIEGTTILGDVRVRVRCHLCRSEEIRSSPQYWKSLMGLTGECFKVVCCFFFVCLFVFLFFFFGGGRLQPLAVVAD